MGANLQWRRSHHPRVLLTAIFLSVAVAACCAQPGNDHQGCPVKIQPLFDAHPFSTLAADEQKKVLRALRDDITEMAELDVASMLTSRAAYRDYFIGHLEFKAIAGTTPAEKLLLLRYNSNTMCGAHKNCPVWIVRITDTKAQTMVPWQEELGTSAGGGWGVGILPSDTSSYPDLILLTHLSSTQTGLACYRESKRSYLRVACSPACNRLFGNGEDRKNGGR